MNNSASIQPSHAPRQEEASASKPLVVSVEEFRRLVGNIGKTLAFALISAGEVKRVRIRGRTCVTYDSIERFIERLIEKGSE